MELQSYINSLLREEDVDELNLRYYLKLIELKFKELSPQGVEIVDLQQLAHLDMQRVGRIYAIPTAMMDEALLAQFPIISYDALLEDKSLQLSLAESCSVWFRPMQAGTGSSIVREKHLRKFSGAGKNLGSKGTDLFISLWDGCPVSLAELQILRALKIGSRHSFKRIILQDVVGPETAKAVRSIWEHPCPLTPGLSYAKALEEGNSEHSVCHFQRELYQAYFPTFNANGELNMKRLAPGGHAFFAVESFFAAVDSALRPPQGKDGNPLVGVLCNGEDLCAFPDKVMVAYMLQHKIPIMMVTTDKTPSDLKGGQLAFMHEVLPDGELHRYVGILEKAQADGLGQGELFKQLGLRVGDGAAFFNTNMVLFNYQELIPLMQECEASFGREFLWDLFSPHLIQNCKKVVENGEPREFWQLEGALGSVVLNVDKFWRRRFGKPLVQIMNISRDRRGEFFSPIKTAFDFYVQFHSDRFAFDAEEMELRDLRCGKGLQVELQDPLYQDVEEVLRLFQGSKIYALDELKIPFFPVNLRDLELSGRVIVESHANEEIQLRDFLPGNLLENVHLIIDEQRRLSFFPL